MRQPYFHLSNAAGSLKSYSTLAVKNVHFPEIIQCSCLQGPHVCGSGWVLTFQVLSEKRSRFAFIFFRTLFLIHLYTDDKQDDAILSKEI